MATFIDRATLHAYGDPDPATLAAYGFEIEPDPDDVKLDRVQAFTSKAPKTAVRAVVFIVSTFIAVIWGLVLIPLTSRFVQGDLQTLFTTFDMLTMIAIGIVVYMSFMHYLIPLPKEG